MVLRLFLVEGIAGYVALAELSVEKVEDINAQFKVGDTVQTKLIAVDP